MLYHEITACRSCNSTRLDTVLNLGHIYISDFIKPGEAEDQAPLELIICQDCTLVQLRHTVNRERLYRNYFYRSNTNESMVTALQDIANCAMEFVPIKSGNILDIGANDGTLLKMFPKTWIRHGYEPSQIAYESNLHTSIIRDFFPSKRKFHAKKYHIITSIACFYDINNPNEFVAAIRDLLHEEGVWVCQFQDLFSMLSSRAFDNICHEHLTYWGQRPLENLLQRYGLHITSMSRNNTNGGSIRYIIKHGTGETMPPSNSDIATIKFQLDNFNYDVNRAKCQTMRLLDNLSSWQLTLGYGASTKGNTLLQHFGIVPELLPAIADRNPDKHGLVTVGTHIPIISEEEMRERNPNYLLALPWHFITSFMEREKSWLQCGGHFIVPLPTTRLVSAIGSALYSTSGGDPCQYTLGETFAKA